jgi:hypothetical protein
MAFDVLTRDGELGSIDYSWACGTSDRKKHFTGEIE